MFYPSMQQGMHYAIKDIYQTTIMTIAILLKVDITAAAATVRALIPCSSISPSQLLTPHYNHYLVI
jgi:hypothetical protein